MAVNVPVSGTVPVASFAAAMKGHEGRFTNTTQAADVYYWTFGDFGASNAISPTHRYPAGGVYTVTLRASSSLAMMGVLSQTVVVGNQVFLPLIKR